MAPRRLGEARGSRPLAYSDYARNTRQEREPGRLPGAARVASRQERAMNPVEIAALDALDLLVVVDNESDTLSSVDKGVPHLPGLGRLVARAREGAAHLYPRWIACRSRCPRRRAGPARRAPRSPQDSLLSPDDWRPSRRPEAGRVRVLVECSVHNQNRQEAWTLWPLPGAAEPSCGDRAAASLKTRWPAGFGTVLPTLASTDHRVRSLRPSR